LSIQPPGSMAVVKTPHGTTEASLPRAPEGSVVLRDRDSAVVDAIVAGRWESPPRLVKSEGKARTWLGDLRAGGDVRSVVVKRIPERRGVKRALHRRLSISPAFRQWRGAKLLEAENVPTSRPLALLRGGGSEWLVLEAVEGEDALRRIHTMRERGASPEVEHALADALGALVAAMDRAGLGNRDHKLSNLIVMPSGGIAIIDTVGVCRGGGDQERMLYAMAAEARGVGILPRRALLMRVLRAAGVHRRITWRAIERAIVQAGNTTPRVNPLEDPNP